MTKLSKTLIFKISVKLVEPMKLKIAEMKSDIDKSATEHLKQFVPSDILNVFEKYPDLFYTRGSAWLFDHYIDIKLPNVHGLVDKMEPDFKKELKDRLKDLKNLETKMNTIFKQIQCSLSGITTLNRLKNEFPEAAEAALEILGEAAISPCDSIEELRAKLSKEIES